VLNSSPLALAVALRKPDTPVKEVALEVKLSVPPLNVIVICPLPLLPVGDSNVQMTSLRLVPIVT
jgi:hypothetical protein